MAAAICDAVLDVHRFINAGAGSLVGTFQLLEGLLTDDLTSAAAKTLLH
jgi:hypothetical protein